MLVIYRPADDSDGGDVGAFVYIAFDVATDECGGGGVDVDDGFRRVRQV